MKFYHWILIIFFFVQIVHFSNAYDLDNELEKKLKKNTANRDHKLKRRLLKNKKNTRHKFRVKYEDIPENLELYVFPFTHLDICWLRTYETYFDSEVQQIFDSVVEALSNSPERTFIISEVGFIKLWWENSDENNRKRFKMLLKKGQIEITGGGFSSNDEATTYYEDIIGILNNKFTYKIDQMSYGHRFLMNNFNYLPEIGWQMDSFGTSMENAFLFEKMGFKSVFFSRLNYQEKNQRQKDHSMQMILDTNQLLNEGNNGKRLYKNHNTKEKIESHQNFRFKSKFQKNIFISIPFREYSFPENFCIDSTCSGWRNRVSVTRENAEEIAKEFFETIVGQIPKNYHTKKIFFILGDDFAYQNAEGYEVQHEDWFPYASNPHEYWTGYFTTRPYLKLLIRESGRFLNKVRTFFAMVLWNSDSNLKAFNFNKNVQIPINKKEIFEDKFKKSLDKLEIAMGISQHHDVVTGTLKKAVMENCINKINNAISLIKNNLYELIYNINKFLFKKKVPLKTEEEFSEYFEETVFENSEKTFNLLENNKNVLLTIYNPTIKRKFPVKIKVPNVQIDVYDIENNLVTSDVFCLQDKSNKQTKKYCDLYFIADLEYFSLNYFFIKPINPKNEMNQEVEIVEQFPIKLNCNKWINFNFENNQITIKDCNQKNELSMCQFYNFNLDYRYYESMRDSEGNSGAYLFRPDSTESKPFVNFKDIRIYKGKNLIILAFYSKDLDSFVKFYSKDNDQDYPFSAIEIETNLKETQVSEYEEDGKEIVLKISSEIKNGNTFYTDMNGLHMAERKVNSKKGYQVEQNEPVSENFYPVDKVILIKDKENSLYVVTDRSEGGTSLNEGEIELMINRRVFNDDRKGLEEAIDENVPIITNHWLIFDSANSQRNIHRDVQVQRDMFPLVLQCQFLCKKFEKYEENIFKLNNDFFIDSFMKFSLEHRINNDGNDHYIARFTNLNENKISAANFTTFVNNIEEQGLSANQPLKSILSNKLFWNGKENNMCKEDSTEHIDYLTQKVYVNPLDIRTFKFEKMAN